RQVGKVAVEPGGWAFAGLLNRMDREFERDPAGLADAFTNALEFPVHPIQEDRKSTRLNSSHVKISYAVFCLKKKKKGHVTYKVSSKCSIEYDKIAKRAQTKFTHRAIPFSNRL